MLETDPVPAQALQLAHAALEDIAPEGAVGDPLGHVVEADGTLSLLFRCLLPGYPGWRWVATLASVGDAEPTVLETELMPGEDALLAPDWVPWSERLAEYQAAQRAVAEAGGDRTAAEEDDSDQDADDQDADDLDDVDDADEYDDHDLDDDEINGVDIDELADAEEEEQEEDGGTGTPAEPDAPQADRP